MGIKDIILKEQQEIYYANEVGNVKRGDLEHFYMIKEKIENNFIIKENIKIEKTDTFISDLKKSVQENNSKLDIISKIDENPDLIYSLSNERLKQLIQLYDEQISIVDNDIIQITNNIKKLEVNN